MRRGDKGREDVRHKKDKTSKNPKTSNSRPADNLPTPFILFVGLQETIAGGKFFGIKKKKKNPKRENNPQNSTATAFISRR